MSQAATGAPAPPPSVSVFRKRLRKFRTLKRGYYSFLLLLFLYVGSFCFPVLINNKAILVRYKGEYYFPFWKFYSARTFGVPGIGEAKYRALQKKFREQGGDDWVLMPFHPYGPNESLLDMPGNPPHKPSREHPLGTDDRARDVLARVAYGFNISISFALLLTFVTYAFGIAIGAMMGYFGGRVDIVGVRLIEIWTTVPFLYVVMIVSSLVTPKFYSGVHELLQPAFWLLIAIFAIFGWMGITFYIRGEFLRERAKDYVSAAVATGASDFAIIFKHILPNALTPVVAFAPFAIVGEISGLVALDYLGFGLPAPTPSWGELFTQGLANVGTNWWLVFFPFYAVFVTLLIFVFIGEAVREAFDPKVFSRLR